MSLFALATAFAMYQSDNWFHPKLVDDSVWHYSESGKYRSVPVSAEDMERAKSHLRQIMQRNMSE